MFNHFEMSILQINIIYQIAVVYDIEISVYVYEIDFLYVILEFRPHIFGFYTGPDELKKSLWECISWNISNKIPVNDGYHS